MLRKIILATAAVASIGAASLVATPASAHWHGGGGWHGGWGGGFHRGWGGPRFAFRGPVYGGYGCVQRRWVQTPWGPRYRVVNSCY